MGHQGASSVQRFIDGELSVTIDEDVAGQEVWVIASTPSSESIIELLLLLDVLQRMQANVNLLLTYCGYARQDSVRSGHAFGAQVFFNCLQRYALQKTIILHIHNRSLEQLFPFDSLVPVDFFCTYAQQVDYIVAPDNGAWYLATTISALTEKPMIVMNKIRSGQHIQYLEYSGNVEGKKVLIVDDMIATGETIMHAAMRLKEDGADAIYVAATHGIFCGDALKIVRQTSIEKIYVTNSLVQRQQHPLIEVVDIGPTLLKSIILSN